MAEKYEYCSTVQRTLNFSRLVVSKVPSSQLEKTPKISLAETLESDLLQISENTWNFTKVCMAGAPLP